VKKKKPAANPRVVLLGRKKGTATGGMASNFSGKRGMIRREGKREKEGGRCDCGAGEATLWAG